MESENKNLKLIKSTNPEYYLVNSEGIMIASSRLTEGLQKLSKQNCDEIFGVIDIRKLADSDFEFELFEGPTTNTDINSMIRKSYLNGAEFGFETAMELQKDKLFTVPEVLKLCTNYYKIGLVEKNKPTNIPDLREEILQDLQKLIQKEIEVEIVMYIDNPCPNCGETDNLHGNYNMDATYRPLNNTLCHKCGQYFYPISKLDENECLILKKKENGKS